MKRCSRTLHWYGTCEIAQNTNLRRLLRPVAKQIAHLCGPDPDHRDAIIQRASNELFSEVFLAWMKEQGK